MATNLSDAMISVVLKGLKGPVYGKTYDAQMLAMENNDDAWIAAVTSYIRNSFFNSGSLVRETDVARVRATLKDHNAPWTEAELTAATPQPLLNRAEWKVSANYNAKSAPLAIDGDLGTRYDTSTFQVPGMWYQVELPQAAILNGVRLEAASSHEDYPRGYKVELSPDGVTWGAPVAEGAGNQPTTEIIFPPAPARFIRITQTGSVQGLYWSIHELSLYTPGEVRKVAPAAKAASKFE